MPNGEEYLEEEPLPEEAVPDIVEEEIPEEEGLEPPEGASAGTSMEHTIDEIPELEGRGIGERISFDITDVSDDGRTFTLEVVPELPEEGIAQAPGGEEELTNRLTFG